jgi:hypothetical protein
MTTINDLKKAFGWTDEQAGTTPAKTSPSTPAPDKKEDK